jgi:hypothetical protein
MSARWIDERLPLLIGLACLLFVLLATTTAHASEWTRVAEVDAVAVTITEVTAAELRAIQAKHARPSSDRSALGRTVPMHRYGFAILHRNKDTGAYRCEVYIASLDPETLEHELRHCDGWVHP